MRITSPARRSLLLSTTADYALRAVLAIARVPSGVARAHEVADAIGAPRNYTAKTLNSLVKAGVLASTRGPSGGFSLAVAPTTLTVARIAGVFDGHTSGQTTRCLLHDRPCDPEHPCVAHERWSDVPRAAQHALATITIADLLGASDTPSGAPSP